jgi:hypothetical protein
VVAARERNGATRGVSSDTARKERYWNGRAIIAAIPHVTNAVTIVGLSKKKSSPSKQPTKRPSMIRIKLNIRFRVIPGPVRNATIAQLHAATIANVPGTPHHVQTRFIVSFRP